MSLRGAARAGMAGMLAAQARHALATAQAQAKAALSGFVGDAEPDWAAYYTEATGLVFRQVTKRPATDLRTLPPAVVKAWILAAKMAHFEYTKAKAAANERQE